MRLRPPRFAIAVSGGPDSLLLCHLINCWVKRSGYPSDSLIALTVDHKLRPESTIEAATVKDLLNSWGLFLIFVYLKLTQLS
jgi:tRNA(Ile)-lysidine synthase